MELLGRQDRIKLPDGKYHLFASRWDQARGHGGWFGSQAVHAVSDNLVRPYVDKRNFAGRPTGTAALTMSPR